PPIDRAGLAGARWNERRRAERSRGAPRCRPPTDRAGLAGPATMIATLSGLVRKKLEDRIVLECGGVGYEVFLPPIAIKRLEHVTAGRGDKARELERGIYYPPTRHQPPPRPT